MAAIPNLFRIILQVSDLDQAFEFYSKLLGVQGRILRGSRAYFDCGPVILAVLDTTPGNAKPQPNADHCYFAVGDLDYKYARASELECLSKEIFHEQKAGEIAVRPWGERSFYVEDPWGNGLCFVDETTIYTGR